MRQTVEMLTPRLNSDTLLTAAVVEGLHTASLTGRSTLVEQAVAALQDATLPGLVEYLCLRHSTTGTLSLPPLPAAVYQSAVGVALQRVVCPFGLRTAGGMVPNTSVNPSEAEFFFLRSEADYRSHAYGLYETRWARAGERAGLRAKQSLMQLAMTAMSENGLLHSRGADGVLVGYRVLPHAALFTVADLGRGVLGSLRSNSKYAHLVHHREALRLALRDGVTCLDMPGGNGFRQLFKALVSQFGTIRFRTGNVCLTMDGQDFDANLGHETFPEDVVGFQVTMCCRVSADTPCDVPLL